MLEESEKRNNYGKKLENVRTKLGLNYENRSTYTPKFDERHHLYC